VGPAAIGCGVLNSALQWNWHLVEIRVTPEEHDKLRLAAQGSKPRNQMSQRRQLQA